jgi:hypothetical protein
MIVTRELTRLTATWWRLTMAAGWSPVRSCVKSVVGQKGGPGAARPENYRVAGPLNQAPALQVPVDVNQDRRNFSVQADKCFGSVALR